ncbi:MAG: threonine ammonia-lyase [Deltaproteobacteria bacterium]|nr:threonine ammonia-lyase [Deltaproteobacteria bacterium]
MTSERSEASPDRADVLAAARRIAGSVVRTPCLESRTLSEITGARVFVKFENLQFTASFKERGALAKLLALSAEERERGVVAMSAGNHAQAVAHHATRLGIRSTIVMPLYTPNVKVEYTQRLGAEVVLHGDDLDAASDRAFALARERGLTFVHPYDDPAVIAGQGTVALEMLEDQPELEALVIPVGGGGLAAGCALVAGDVAVYGVEPERFPSMKQALAGESIACGRDTIAEGIAVKRPGERTRAILRSRLREMLLVSEIDLEEAVLALLEIEKTVAEGAGAAALAAVMRHRALFAGKRVGVVLSGGNIDLLVLASIIERGLARSRRLVRLRIQLPDRPGALADVARIVAEARANVIEIHHERAFGRVPLKEAQVELVVSTRGGDHLRALCEALRAGGYDATLPDL